MIGPGLVFPCVACKYIQILVVLQDFRQYLWLGVQASQLVLIKSREFANLASVLYLGADSVDQRVDAP
jgi:hypothetical protein